MNGRAVGAAYLRSAELPSARSATAPCQPRRSFRYGEQRWPRRDAVLDEREVLQAATKPLSRVDFPTEIGNVQILHHFASPHVLASRTRDRAS